MLIQLAVGVCHVSLTGLACVLGRRGRPGKGLKKTESAAHLTDAVEVERPPAWKLVLSSWGKTAAQVALVFYAALSILSVYEIQRSPCGTEDSTRVGGWLWLVVYVVGGILFAVFSAVSCCCAASSTPLASRVWPVWTLLDRVVSVLLLLFLADRPGTQAGAMLAKQLIYLMGLLLLKPAQGSVAHGVMTLVATGRAIILTLMLAFIPPHDVAGSAELELVGYVIVGVQLLLAVVLIGLVLLRFGTIAARFGKESSPAKHESEATKKDVGTSDLLSNPLYATRRPKSKGKTPKVLEDAKDEPERVEVEVAPKEREEPVELATLASAESDPTAELRSQSVDGGNEQRIQFVPVRAHGSAVGSNSRAQANPLLRPKRPIKG